MPKYLVTGRYSPDGVKGVLKSGGTARTKAVGEAVKGIGGSIESFYFAFGKDDVFVVVDVPDNVAAAALAMGVSATGLVGVRMTVLLTPAEIDDAAKRQVAYTPPGK